MEEKAAEIFDTLKARLKEADRQLKQSRRALHDADRAASELRDRLQASERQRERDRAELAQLREALYLMEQRSPDEEEIPDAQIELPWRSKRRVVVFGGHDSWLKAIRPLLPNVRFFGHELPDLGAIRSADAVWLQANSMPHKHYYRIIEEVRKGDIPIRYFRYASARKCAEQLASTEDDVWDSPGDQA